MGRLPAGPYFEKTTGCDGGAGVIGYASVPLLHCSNGRVIDKLAGLLERSGRIGERRANRVSLRREWRVRNSIAHGRHVATRTALLQVGASMLAAAGLAAGFGGRAGFTALLGGLVISVGNVLFALRLFGRGVAPARDALRSMYAAELLKWVWLGAMLFLAIAVWKLPFPALITGIMAAQVAFWIALIATR